MTVGELSTHRAFGSRFHEQVNLIEKRTTMAGFDFMAFIEPLKAEQSKPRTKAEIVALLRGKTERSSPSR